MLCKVRDGIYGHNSTKFVFQANPAPEFADSSLDEGPQRHEPPHQCPTALQVRKTPMKAEGGDSRAVFAAYMA